MSALGQLVVKLALDHAEYVQGLDRSSQEALKFAQNAQRSFDTAGSASKEFMLGVVKGAAGAAAAYMSVSAVISSLNRSIDELDGLNDVADATGSSIENLSALEDVAKRTGTTMENVSGILVKFNEVLSEADKDSGTARALKAIGLDAEELKKIDPAEALRQTAAALANYAGDGDRARYVQELFGKSVKEAAPFLNDLAEQTELVAKVTAEQTAQAEQYNKNLAAMNTNIDNVSRSIVNSLVPALNQAFDRFNRARQAGQGFIQSLMNGLGRDGGASANPYQALEEANKEIARIEALGAAGSKSAQTARQRQLEDAKAKAAVAQSYIDEWQANLDAAPSAPRALGYVSFKDDPKTKTKAKKLTDEQKADAEFMKEVWRLYEEATNAGNKAANDLILSNHAAAEAYRDILDPAREIHREMERIDELVAAGALTPEEGAAAQVAKLKDAYKDVGDSVNAIDEIQKNLYKGMQDSLGDGFYNMMNGNFDKIGDGFADMVKRMLAEAAAAKLMKTLFGDLAGSSGGSGGSGGSLGGLVGSVFKWLASANGNAFSAGRLVPFANGGAFTNSIATGPSVAPMALFGEAGPEAIMPLERDSAGRLGVRASGSGGKATTIHFAPVYQISGALDEQRTRQIAAEAAQNSSAQLVDTLTREGKIQR